MFPFEYVSTCGGKTHLFTVDLSILVNRSPKSTFEGGSVGQWVWRSASKQQVDRLSLLSYFPPSLLSILFAPRGSFCPLSAAGVY